VAGIRQTKRLIVEGIDDRHSVIGLMRHHVTWPKEKDDAPVWIALGNSADEILADDFLPTEIKTPGIDILGVVLDADTAPPGRYQRICQLCSELFPVIPKSPPSGGMITENDGRRFGLWIMPDNLSDGCLETFLRHLVPNQSQPLWQLAMKSVADAKSVGAACRDCHTDKSNLYTWLAWQDPPGQSPGLALTQKCLDPHAPSANLFVKWFRELYRL
jgi:hypothetical protein